jgi:hypothetical protein
MLSTLPPLTLARKHAVRHQWPGGAGGAGGRSSLQVTLIRSLWIAKVATAAHVGGSRGRGRQTVAESVAAMVRRSALQPA